VFGRCFSFCIKLFTAPPNPAKPCQSKSTICQLEMTDRPHNLHRRHAELNHASASFCIIRQYILLTIQVLKTLQNSTRITPPPALMATQPTMAHHVPFMSLVYSARRTYPFQANPRSWRHTRARQDQGSRMKRVQLNQPPSTSTALPYPISQTRSVLTRSKH